jgi:hypothetical protein
MSRIKNAGLYLGLPLVILVVIAVFAWWVPTIKPLPPPEHPMNGTLLAVLVIPLICWGFAALLLYISKGDTEEDYIVQGFGQFAFWIGWIGLGFMVLVVALGHCNIWPWEPAVCNSGKP